MASVAGLPGAVAEAGVLHMVAGEVSEVEVDPEDEGDSDVETKVSREVFESP